jgi:hypothetical protein
MRMGKLKMRVADRREPFRLRYGKVEGAALASARHRYRAAATEGERAIAMRMGKLKMRVADRREPFRLRYGKVRGLRWLRLGIAIALPLQRKSAAATAGERCRYGRRSFNWTQNFASWLDLQREGRFAARLPK